jgi:hypothetical protein
LFSSVTFSYPLITELDFAGGDISDWDYDYFDANGAFLDPPHVWWVGDEYYVDLAGGIIGDSSQNQWGRLSTTALMPDASDVRFSFWVRAFTAVSTATHADGFRAVIDNGTSSVEFHLSAQQNSSYQIDYYMDTRAGDWSVQQYDWWDSWVVTSDNLAEYFDPGDELQVTFLDTIYNHSVPPSTHRINQLIASVGFGPPELSGPIPLRDNVYLIPEPGVLALLGLGLLSLGLTRRVAV